MNLDFMNNLGSTITIMVAVPFILIALVFIVIGVRARLRASASRSWPSTMGRVLSASVEARTSTSSEGGTSTSYYPVVLYEYQVNGQTYRNNRLTLGSQMGSGSGWAQGRAAQYPTGSIVQVYYNPENPLDSTLEQRAPASNIFFIIALVIIIILVVTVLFTTGINNMVGGFLPR